MRCIFRYIVCPGIDVGNRIYDRLSGTLLKGMFDFTVRRSFVQAKAKPNETVLIHGASGGVGIAACQVARAHGMRVIGTAGTDEGAKVVKDNGAEWVFNHRETNYIEKIQKQFPGGTSI